MTSASKSTRSSHIEYLNRINRVIEFVEQNLDQTLDLKTLAGKAFFSPFHFHRVFSLVVGETAHEFVTRKRLEKAAAIILAGKKHSFSDLAIRHGFESPASFSRAFRRYYGVTASEFKKQAKSGFKKIVKQDSKIGKETVSLETYIQNADELKRWAELNAKMEERHLPEQRLVFVRNRGDFSRVPDAFRRLVQWARSAGLLKDREPKLLMVIHDNPAVTGRDHLMQSACLRIEKAIVPAGEVGTMTLAGGRFLVGGFVLRKDEFERAWNAMTVWMAEKGLTSRDGAYFELFHGNSLVPFMEEHRVDICIPIR